MQLVHQSRIPRTKLTVVQFYSVSVVQTQVLGIIKPIMKLNAFMYLNLCFPTSIACWTLTFRSITVHKKHTSCKTYPSRLTQSASLSIKSVRQTTSYFRLYLDVC